MRGRCSRTVAVHAQAVIPRLLRQTRLHPLGGFLDDVGGRPDGVEVDGDAVRLARVFRRDGGSVARDGRPAVCFDVGLAHFGGDRCGDGDDVEHWDGWTVEVETFCRIYLCRPARVRAG